MSKKSRKQTHIPNVQSTQIGEGVIEKNKKEIISLPDELSRIFQKLDEEYLQSFMPLDKDHDSDAAQLSEVIENNSATQEQENKEAKRQKVQKFLNEPCACGKNCRSQFSVDEVLDAREDFKSMSRNEQNCFILGQLRTFIRNSPEAKNARMHKPRERQKFEYHINADRPVCRDMFLFFHGETLKRLKRFQKYLIEVGTMSPVHGNAGKKPIHACSDADKVKVKQFIINYAVIHGLPDPVHDIRPREEKVRIFLPSIMTYKSIHRIYEKCMHGRKEKIVQYDTFRELWHKLVPHIVFRKPRSDLCLTCENHRKAINMAAASLKEEEKIFYLKEAVNHLQEARKERDYYRQSLKIAKQSYSCGNLASPHTPNSIDIPMHYSWDFAQQIYYPYEDQQVGPIYFKTPRIAQLFGVCCEAIPRQVNYLIDEADFIGKNSDTVVSLIDHFFSTYGLGETHVYLTADNCVAQNKNNAVLHYLLYRTMIGLHKRINLSFMLVGHTKFIPDAYFGLIKLIYRRSKIYTYRQMVNVINSSTVGRYNICQTFTNDKEERNFKYRNWSTWLLKYFKKLPNISKYHHFLFDESKPGIVVVKKSVDEEEKAIQLLHDPTFQFDSKSLSELPEEIVPKGLSAERSWYLYDNIREHIPTTQDKDTTCPLPNVPRPKKAKPDEKISFLPASNMCNYS